jgi:glycosyltransferase involved in cell wall biosynthesis
MARGKIVLAPAINGIPELVRDGETGFLYQPGSLQDCLAKLRFVCSQMTLDESGGLLHDMRRRATAHVDQNFNRTRNLQSFADLFLQRTAAARRNRTNASLILQQV